MTKIIRNVTLISALFISVLILVLHSIITKTFAYSYTISFILGTFSSVFCLYITDWSLEKFERRELNNPKAWFVSISLLKFIIYGLTFALALLIFDYLSVIFVFFGMILMKIVIYLRYLVIIPWQDKRRKIEELAINDSIKEKLKENGYLLVMQITEVDRIKLGTFLSDDETEAVIKSLKQYELFIKGELGAIEDDDINF